MPLERRPKADKVGLEWPKGTLRRRHSLCPGVDPESIWKAGFITVLGSR